MTKTSNNPAEYEAILAGLSLAREVGVKRLTCKTDSKLTVGNLNDKFQIKDPILLQYYHLVRAIIQSAFEQVRIEHIPKDRQHQGRYSLQIGQHQAKKPSPILTTANTIHAFHHTLVKI